MAKVPNGVETLSKISIARVGHTNVTDRQTTDGWTATYSCSCSLKKFNGEKIAEEKKKIVYDKFCKQTNTKNIYLSVSNHKKF